METLLNSVRRLIPINKESSFQLFRYMNSIQNPNVTFIQLKPNLHKIQQNNQVATVLEQSIIPMDRHALVKFDILKRHFHTKLPKTTRPSTRQKLEKYESSISRDINKSIIQEPSVVECNMRQTTCPFGEYNFNNYCEYQETKWTVHSQKPINCPWLNNDTKD